MSTLSSFPHCFFVLFLFPFPCGLVRRYSNLLGREMGFCSEKEEEEREWVSFLFFVFSRVSFQVSSQSRGEQGKSKRTTFDGISELGRNGVSAQRMAEKRGGR